MKSRCGFPGAMLALALACVGSPVWAVDRDAAVGDNVPQKVGFFLVPKFSMMAFAAAIEPLRAAVRRRRRLAQPAGLRAVADRIAVDIGDFSRQRAALAFDHDDVEQIFAGSWSGERERDRANDPHRDHRGRNPPRQVPDVRRLPH